MTASSTRVKNRTEREALGESWWNRWKQPVAQEVNGKLDCLRASRHLQLSVQNAFLAVRVDS